MSPSKNVQRSLDAVRETVITARERLTDEEWQEFATAMAAEGYDRLHDQEKCMDEEEEEKWTKE